VTPIIVSAIAIVLGAEVRVEAGGDLAAAAGRLQPGDTLRLGPGLHRGSLGRLAGVRVVGAGAGVTEVRAPEGQDGAVITGEVALSGLSLLAGPNRAALKVLGGAATLDGVALDAGACGAYLDEGRLEGRDLWLSGGYGLLQRRGEARLVEVTARGRIAGLALLGGALEVRRAAVTGPGREAGITVAGGTARLEQVIIRDPGPSGLAVSGGEVDARDLTVSGASGQDGAFGDCLQVRRGTVRLSASELTRCGGAAVETDRAAVALDGVDAGSGEVGCLVFTGGTRATLAATLCAGRGPGLVAMGGSTVETFGARFWTAEAMVVECATGARVTLRDLPEARQPCFKGP